MSQPKEMQRNEKPTYSYLGLVAGAYPLLALAREKYISAVSRSGWATQENLQKQRGDGAKMVDRDKAYKQTKVKYGLGIMFFTIPLFELPF